MARWILVIPGAILAFFGGVWFLQGLAILPGTFMYGSRTWIMIGLVVLILGLFLAKKGFGHK